CTFMVESRHLAGSRDVHRSGLSMKWVSVSMILAGIAIAPFVGIPTAPSANRPGAPGHPGSPPAAPGPAPRHPRRPAHRPPAASLKHAYHTHSNHGKTAAPRHAD